MITSLILPEETAHTCILGSIGIYVLGSPICSWSRLIYESIHHLKQKKRPPKKHAQAQNRKGRGGQYLVVLEVYKSISSFYLDFLGVHLVLALEVI